MMHRSPHRYEPIVLDVGMDEYGYRFVILSLWPGARLRVTLTGQAQSVDQAKQAALLMVPNIMALIRG